MARRNPRRWAIVSSAFLSMVALPAKGHGGIPRAITISVAPGDPAHIAAQSDAWGLLVTDDGGATLSWLCPEVFEGEALGVIHPTTTLTADGRLLVANEGHGLWRATRDGCGWEASAAVAGETVRDLAQSSDGSELFVLTSRVEGSEAVNRLWRSTDGAETLAPWGSELPRDVVAAAVAIHFGDRRIYVTGVDGVSREVALLSSSDEGTSWERTATPIVTGLSRARLTVDPTDATRLFLRHDRLPASQSDPDPGDDLYLSTDGGATFVLLLEGGSDLPGLAFSPDGAKVAVAGPAEGLLVADKGELAGLGGAAFRRVFDAPLWGLAWTEEGLYAGHDDFSEAGSGMWLGVSTDGGETFSSVATICDAAPASCGAATAYGMTCEDAFTRLAGFRESILLGPSCTTPAPPEDAGATPPPPPPPRDDDPPGGCACASSRSRSGPGAMLGCGLAALGIARRFRRGRPAHGSVQT